MAEPIELPPGVAFAIIAFILSLVPAGLFLWLVYLRRTDRPVPLSAVASAFGAGLGLVMVAYYAEKFVSSWWGNFSPTTAHYMAGPLFPLQGLPDLLFPALAAFGVIAAIEEGIRYVVLYLWFRKSKAVDQIFDGLVLGVAIGLGFATLENTIYFLELFQSSHFDTLVFVFFLRFLFSTLAHISFGGIMGVLLARGMFSMYRPGRYILQAFFIPWLLHGLFDLLITLNLTLYAVLILIPALAVLILWSIRRDFFVISRRQGTLLVFEEPPPTKRSHLVKKFLEQFDSPWNKNAPWLKERRQNGQLLQELEKP